MVDTVKCTFASAKWLELPPGWKQATSRYDKSSHEALYDSGRRSRRCSHEATGLQVGGNEKGATWFEVSIPRLANGDNALLLTSEIELDAAKMEVGRTIRQVCEFLQNESTAIAVRTDVVLYIPVPLADTMAAHRSSRHPKISKNASEYVGESLRFKGANRICRMYSSDLLKHRRTGHSTRVEWQLRTSALQRDFGKIVRWPELNLEDCYQVYRNLCLGFDVAEVVSLNSIHSFLALAEKNGWRHQGIPVVELYCRSRPTTANKIRKKISACRSQVFNFSWDQFLPTTFQQYQERVAPRLKAPPANSDL
jgi:hypothetical protein